MNDKHFTGKIIANKGSPSKKLNYLEHDNSKLYFKFDHIEKDFLFKKSVNERKNIFCNFIDDTCRKCDRTFYSAVIDLEDGLGNQLEEEETIKLFFYIMNRHFKGCLGVMAIHKNEKDECNKHKHMHIEISSRDYNMKVLNITNEKYYYFFKDVNDYLRKHGIQKEFKLIQPGNFGVNKGKSNLLGHNLKTSINRFPQTQRLNNFRRMINRICIDPKNEIDQNAYADHFGFESNNEFINNLKNNLKKNERYINSLTAKKPRKKQGFLEILWEMLRIETIYFRRMLMLMELEKAKKKKKEIENQREEFEKTQREIKRKKELIETEKFCNKFSNIVSAIISESKNKNVQKSGHDF
ncbi:MAG TPA: hypothetical protein PKY81_09210 [bacterium]|nr:hypothetical protein [bacterium]